MTTYREVARWGVWAQRADVLHSDYADMLVAAGAVPMLLPPALPSAEAARGVAARIDGLVIAGGADVDPARYGASPHESTSGWREDRDQWELALIDAAAERDLPVLGVCRGMQLLAVHAGGDLIQHLPDTLGHTAHSPGGAEFGTIEVTTVAGSRVASMVGESLTVHCHHHQAVASHPGFERTAEAADGCPEAFELPGPRFCVGVQWHPEVGTELALMQGLVGAAGGRS